MSSVTGRAIEVNLTILKKSCGFVSRFLSGASRGEFVQRYSLINVTGLVEPTELGLVSEKF